MTDARLPERWLTDPLRSALSDGAWRVYSFGLMYCNAHGTDGELPPQALRYLHSDDHLARAAVAELIDCGLLLDRGELGYRFPEWDTTLGQSRAADVEQRRVQERERKRIQRERRRNAAGSAQVTSEARVPPDVPRVVPRDSAGQDRTGQDRTSKPLPTQLGARTPRTPASSTPPVGSPPAQTVPDWLTRVPGTDTYTNGSG